MIGNNIVLSSLDTLLIFAVTYGGLLFVWFMTFRLISDRRKNEVTQNNTQATNELENTSQIHYPFYAKFWFSWIVITISYLTLYYYLFVEGWGNPHSEHLILGRITGFLGLFVPLSMTQNELISSFLFAWVIFVLTIGENLLNKFRVGLSEKIILNLLVFLVTTIVADFIRFTPFASWIIFLSNYYGH